jgi:hypothetical protein
VKILLSVCLVIVSLPSFAQYSIQGTVLDADTQTPLPGANVFLANTTKGVSTNTDGTFTITGLQSVHYQLVISFVGYKTEAIDVVPGQPITYKVMLAPLAQTLREIIVRARKEPPALRRRHIKIFKDHFIGLSDNASQCSIANPKSLGFEMDGTTLNAYTDSILFIDNKGLGYRVKVLLNEYEFNTATTRLHYEGPMGFEQLTPVSEKQNREWAKNRLKAYRGSFMHFVRSLYNHRLKEEGFRFKISTDSVYSFLSGCSTLFFKDVLAVEYMKEKESRNYPRSQNNFQLSHFKLLEPVTVEPSGDVYPISAVEFRGYWSWELMAEMLPLDYEPQDDIKLLEKK